MKKGKMSEKEMEAAREGHAAYSRHWRLNRESKRTKELRRLLKESKKKDLDGSKK